MKALHGLGPARLGLVPEPVTLPQACLRGRCVGPRVLTAVVTTCLLAPASEPLELAAGQIPESRGCNQLHELMRA